MSVISIRPAQESLRNIGNIRTPQRMPHFVAPDMSGQKSMARAYGDLGRGIERLGEVGLRFAIAAKREDEDRRLAAAGAEYQRLLQIGFLEGDGALMARKGDDLEGEGLERTEGDTRQLFSTSFDEVCTKYEIDGDLKEKFKLHVAPVDLSWNGRMDGHVMVERQKNRISAADSLVEKDEEDWAGDKFNAPMTQKLLDDYDHKLKVRGATDEVRSGEVRKYALGLAAGIARSSFDNLGSEETYDKQIKVLEENPDALFSDNAELRDRLGSNALPEKTVQLLVGEAKLKKERFVRGEAKKMNAEVDSLISKGGEAAVKAQFGTTPDERGAALQQMDAQIDALKQKGGELPEGSKVRLSAFEAAAKLDKAADALAEQQMIDQFYEDQKVDRDLRLYSPEVRDGSGKVAQAEKRAYPEGTRKGRLCAKIQAEIDKERAKRTDAERTANANMLSWSLNQLNAAKLDGSISQEEASLTQAAIWAKYKTCLSAGSLPAGFGNTFLSSIKTTLSDQEANAMRKFYRAFGYAPDLKSDGDVGVSERNAARKDSMDYYAPVEENGQRVESRKTRVRAWELLEYGDALLKTLRTKGPDINREGVVDEVISHLKSNWIAGDHRKNIQAIADVAQKSTILFRGRLGAALEGNGAQRPKDTERRGGRDGDDSAAK